MAIRHVLGILAALSLGAGTTWAATSEPPPDAAPTDAQPHMKAARALLQTAKTQLERASHDKGGHRAKALSHVRAALGEVDKGIAFDNAHKASADVELTPLEAQAHMKVALKTLEAAKVQLERATHDKGGHRGKAIHEVNAAITEVKKGVAYDNRH